MINKDKAYPTWLAILKLTSTVGVSITFIVVLVYLMPLLGFFACLKGGNFFMHLVIPLTAIFQLIFFVPKKDFRWSFNFFSAFPVTIYGVFYMINIAIHDGYGIIEYDWYYFGAKGMAMGIIILVILIIASLGFSFLLYKIYRIPLKKKTAD